MSTEMINIKLEKDFLKEIDKVVKENHYQSRTEFIRETIRTSLEQHKMRQALLDVDKLIGSATPTSKKPLEKVRDELFDQMRSSGK